MKPPLLFLLILCMLVNSESVSGLYGQIKQKPHSLCSIDGQRVEVEGRSFFSIPELYEGRLAATIPVLNGACAISLSSVHLDSIYGELSGSLAIGQKIDRVSIGTNLLLNCSDIYGIDRLFLPSVTLSFAYLISRNIEAFAVLPTIDRLASGGWLLADDWRVGMLMRHDSLKMDIEVELLKMEYSEVAVQLSQAWQPHDNIILYGSVLSNPLKISFGVTILFQKILVGAFYESHHSLGSVKTATVGYFKTK